MVVDYLVLCFEFKSLLPDILKHIYFDVCRLSDKSICKLRKNTSSIWCREVVAVAAQGATLQFKVCLNCMLNFQGRDIPKA